MWFRVFGGNEVQPEPDGILAYLHARGYEAEGHFRADDDGWFEAVLDLTKIGVALRMNRFMAAEEGIRAELNNWAAWLETREDQPHSEPLMRRMIGVKQIFVWFFPEHLKNGGSLEKLCRQMCQYLAGLTEGVYQVDGQGFFDKDGVLLVPE